MFKITIVSLFCDKDYQLVDQFLSYIKERVHCSYEVILIDNTSPEVHETIKYLYDKYSFIYRHPNNKNVRQLMARLYAMQFVQGQYTWFVDIDDEILYFADDLISDADVTYYGFLGNNDYVYNPGTGIVTMEKDIQKRDLDVIVLWNKIFLTSTLKKAIKVLPNDIEVCPFEDTIILISVLKQIKEYYRNPVIIIHKTEGITNKDHFKISDIDYICYGIDKANAILKNLLSPNEMKTLFVNGSPTYENCNWVFHNIIIDIDINFVNLTKKLLDYFDKNMILDIYNAQINELIDQAGFRKDNLPNAAKDWLNHRQKLLEAILC